MSLEDTEFALVDDAIAVDNSCLQIKTNINLNHFKPNFSAIDIDHLSSEPFVAAPETLTTPAAQQSPVMSEQTHHLFKRLSSPPGGCTGTQLDGGQQTQDAGSAIDPDDLPADAQDGCSSALQALSDPPGNQVKTSQVEQSIAGSLATVSQLGT